MLWVDSDQYFGPDRRRGHKLRMLDRRKDNRAQRPPSVPTALRQLRFRVIEATGEGAVALATRMEGVARLAQADHETRASAMLTKLAQHVATRGSQVDLRDKIYGHLDQIYAALRAA
jgi:hypothetical protein